MQLGGLKKRRTLPKAPSLNKCRKMIRRSPPFTGNEASIDKATYMRSMELAENDQEQSNHTENEQSSTALFGKATSLDSLIRNLRSLTFKIQELESALELANRKIAVYEGFDESIRDTMAYSLRKAFEIREKSEQEAKGLLTRARSEEAALREEVKKLTGERDALAAERDALRQSVEEARSELERQASQQAAQRREKEQLLAEVLTLERRLQTIRSSIESPPAESRLRAAEPNQVWSVDTKRFPAMGTSGSILDTCNDVSETPAASKLVGNESQDLLEVTPLSTDASLYSPTAVTEAEREQPSTKDESSANKAVAVTAEVELVVSPVHGFPKLVELERALQTLSEVKSFYVRDFHYGVATLLLRLASPEMREDLPAKLESLPGWGLTILSCPPNRIEAKIGA